MNSDIRQPDPKPDDQVASEEVNTPVQPPSLTTAQPVQPKPSFFRKPVARPSRKKLLIIGGIIVIVLAGAVAAALHQFYKPAAGKQPASAKSQPAGTAEPALAANLRPCFTRFGYINCVDTTGQNRVRYDLPKLPDGTKAYRLATIPSQQKYLAVYINDDSDTSLWVLNASLQLDKQLPVDATHGVDPNVFALSTDGKTAFVKLITKQGAKTDVFRYDLDTMKATQLTHSGTVDNIAATTDGHVLYSEASTIKVMNADGSAVRTLTHAPIAQLLTSQEFSYDNRTDKIILYGSDANQKSQYGYATLPDFMAGKPLKTVTTANYEFSDGFFVGQDTIMGYQISRASFVDAHGKVTHVMQKGGMPIGLLDPAKLTKSKEQTEQLADIITGYDKAPADFQAYIGQVYQKQNAACTSDAASPDVAGTWEYSIGIVGVVRDTFAETSESCSDGGHVYYKKVNGAWTQTNLAGQAANDCKDVNTYAFTKELIPTCYQNSAVIANTNP